jgi:hypothetical protein
MLATQEFRSSSREANLGSATLTAGRFERTHQVCMHWLIVGTACLTYLRDRDDVVWRFIKNRGAEIRPLEHATFLVATVLVAVGAYLCTFSRIGAKDSPDWKPHQRNRSHNYLGQSVYAVGLATLLPLAGFLILTTGEAARLIRLLIYNDEPNENISSPVIHWATAARAEAVKWGLLISMIVFTVTLRDAYADYLICASLLVGAVVNLPPLRRRAHHRCA